MSTRGVIYSPKTRRMSEGGGGGHLTGRHPQSAHDGTVVCGTEGEILLRLDARKIPTKGPRARESRRRLVERG